MKRKLAIVAIGESFLAAGTVEARTSVEAAIARLFAADHIQAVWFEEAFLARQPLANEQASIDDIKATLGRYDSIERGRHGYTVSFARGSIQANAKLSSRDAIVSLQISRMQSRAVEERLSDLFRVAEIPEGWFGTTMLSETPIGDIRKKIASLKQECGSFTSIDPLFDGSYNIEFSVKNMTADAFLGSDGKLSVLTLQPH